MLCLLLRVTVKCLATATLLAACTLGENPPQVVYVTATLPALSTEAMATPLPLRSDLSPVPDMPQPTSDPIRFDIREDPAMQHVVQSGDTLYGIAASYGVSLDALLETNALENPDMLYVGQVIQLPELPSQETPNFKIISDSRFVRAPGSGAFDIAGFVTRQPGYIRFATDTVETRLANGTAIEETLTAAQVVERVSLEYSVDPRLLLALLEYRAGWLSTPVLSEGLETHPMISVEDSRGVDRSGLYHQLEWTADQLNRGYYGWKCRGWMTLEFSSGERFLFAPGLNAATVALQYIFSLNASVDSWRQNVDGHGFYRTYYAYFGDPFAGAIEPLVPPDLQQPPMKLPFASGETWYFTGGPHGGWGSGSAWAALDFAPPDDPPDGVFCYTSNAFACAVAPGLIARSGGGVVVLDLDGDGDESTGWTVLYLHIASQDRVATGTWVQAGDPIGRVSCEGGVSTATHLHVARRYNGEWIPADCQDCASHHARPRFKMSDWAVVGIRNQEYQGYLIRNEEQRVADQGRANPNNQISW